jgi:SAM-dependent methyltransferase
MVLILAVIMRTLSRETEHRTSAAVSALFDMELRALRRDRAARIGPELFLLERAFADCLERLLLMQRGFARALLIGAPDPAWPARLREFCQSVDVRDPGALVARAAGGEAIIEDAWVPSPASYDLVLSIGTLDTVNDLPRALMNVRLAMTPGGLFLGAMSGGDTLPQLRSAMRAADALMGAASPHVHPRIEASAVPPLLSRCGFADPVVDVDRVQVSYESLSRLVDDLRRMGATNLLSQRSRRSLSRRATAAAAKNFAGAGEEVRTIETFEILHFACWTPPADAQAPEG